MKKYLFLILISCILILTAVLAGLSLSPYSLENETGFFQGTVDPAVSAYGAEGRENGLGIEYVNDQAILVQLPDPHLQEQLALVLVSSPFNPEDKGYETVTEWACPTASVAPKLGAPAQIPAEMGQGGEDTLQPQADEAYVIYIRHYSPATPQEYTLVVDQEEPQPELSATCTTPAKDS
jgi:hypothetical protein